MAKRGSVRRQAPKDEIERPARSRKYTYHILIVCEDENTEKYYFQKYADRFQEIWPNETVYLRAVGTGRNSLGVVRRAIAERNTLAEEARKSVDMTWAVFDKDDLDKSEGNVRNFNEAFELGKQEDVKIAYSNECFELWLLLHYRGIDPKDGPVPRVRLYELLETEIRKHNQDFVYEHGKNNVIDEVLKTDNANTAIKRAAYLDNRHIQNGHAPIEANPNTLVYKLVSELEDLLSYYGYDG